MNDYMNKQSVITQNSHEPPFLEGTQGIPSKNAWTFSQAKITVFSQAKTYCKII